MIQVNVQVGEEAWITLSSSVDEGPNIEVVLGAHGNTEIEFKEDYSHKMAVKLYMPLSKYEEREFHFAWDLESKRLSVTYYPGGFPTTVPHYWQNALTEINFITVRTGYVIN